MILRKLTFALTLSLGLVALISVAHSPAHASNDRRFTNSRYASLQGSNAMNTTEARLTIRSIVARQPVPGGADRAICIASAESGLREHAYNPSTAGGEFQVIASTWASWTRSFANWRRQQHVGGSRFKGRANIMLSIHAAHVAGSWGAWTTAGGCS